MLPDLSDKDSDLVGNFFGNARQGSIDRNLGEVPTRNEIQKCIQKTKSAYRAKVSGRSRASFDFRELEMDEYEMVRTNNTVTGTSNGASFYYSSVNKV